MHGECTIIAICVEASLQAGLYRTVSNLDCLKDDSIQAMGSGLAMMLDCACLYVTERKGVTLRNHQCCFINLLKMLLSQMVHNHDCA